MERPSSVELHSRITRALAAISAGKLIFPTSKHITSDLDELGIDENELITALKEGLYEIRALDPEACWAGKRPPERSYEPCIKRLELWAFCWDSGVFRRKMYLKFALKEDALKRESFVYVDCHPSRY